MKNFKNIMIVKEDRCEVGDCLFDSSFLALSKNDLEGEDYSSKIMIPGFFDVHTHGANGYDFSTVKDLKEIDELLKFYISKGVTSLFPTLLTEHDETVYKQLELIYEAKKNNPIIKGIHIEGPFLSLEYKGAQLEECIQKPSIQKVDEYIKHSHGLFKYMTIAPEREDAPKVISYMASKGIRVAMGHSSATFDETKAGYEAGARSITHCFNAMKGLHQHFPSITTAALYFDDLYTELIMDGIHVVPEMAEFLRKIKGNDKVVGITDSLMCAGLPDGEYMIGNSPIIVKNQDAKLKDSGVRAGSCLTMDRAFKNIKKFCSLDDVIGTHLTSLNAAKLMGMDDKIGSIKEGKSADFVILNKNYEIEEVYINGTRYF